MNAESEKIYWELYFTLKEQIIQEVNVNLGITSDLDVPMTVSEVLECYKLSESTLYRYVRDGLKTQTKGKYCKKLFTKRQINQFLEAKKNVSMTDRIVIANNELDINFDRLNLPDAYNGSDKVSITNEETGRFRILKYRLYKNENFSDTDPFLTLKKDITRSGFSISGNLRRWWFGWESTIQDLNKKQYKQCINHIAKRLRLSKTEFWESRVTYVEIGGNIRLPKKYEFIISAMVSFPQLKSCKFGTETASFKNRQRDVISYNKFRQLYDNRVINKRVFEVLNEKIFVLRFEVKLKIPSASPLRTQVNTLRNIKTNWNTIIDHWENTFYKIKINKIQNLKIKAMNKGLTRREFKDYCLALAVQEYGIDTINNVINTNFTRKHSEERKHVLEICKKYADETSVQYVQDVYNAVTKKACTLKRLY